MRTVRPQEEGPSVCRFELDRVGALKRNGISEAGRLRQLDMRAGYVCILTVAKRHCLPKRKSISEANGLRFVAGYAQRKKGD